MPPQTLAPPAKRQKRLTALVEDDVKAAEAVTHEKVTHTTRSGTRRTKNVLVPLVPVVDKQEKASQPTVEPIKYHDNYEIPDHEPNPLPKKSKVDTVIALCDIYILLMWDYAKTQ